MPENILIIKPSSVGDVVHALPVLSKLRVAFPQARISWLVGTAAAPIVESSRRLDRVFYFHRRRGGPLGTLKAGLRLAGELSREGFDCAIDLQGLLRSAFFAWASRAPQRVGLSDAREGARFFYTDVAKVSPGMHAVERYLEVGDVLGFDTGNPEFVIDVPQGARRSVARMLESGPESFPRPHFALSPGARWQSKLPPAENFSELARLLLGKFGGTVFLVGTPGEAGRAAEQIASSVDGNVVNLVGRTSLDEIAALFARLDILITPDTGLMHIADALGLPLVAVFGPTDPVKTGPYFQRDRVLTSDVCSRAPCFKRRSVHEYCDAMTAVSGREVFDRACAVLEEGR